ncbi:DUF342 domain-containing protein [Marimonas lutisalis]|uniref:DUF342 domain-containing protein n=1 Tax=Marimonas lutisalis TaxID=2545756 RepID=UPI0010F5723F|nr:DUF342 domain-containing protein [Marimonas lutisalis]
MSSTDFVKALETLESRIEALPDDKRHELQPEIQALVDKMAAEGEQVPDRLRALDERQDDAAIEAQFDNLPV